MIKFSPFDIRIILRVALFLIGWRYLSSDFLALPDLVREINICPLSPYWLDQFVTWLQRRLFTTTMSTVVFQGMVILLVFAGFVTLRRFVLVAAVLTAILLELTLYHFRSAICELEVPIMVVAILCCFPGRCYAGNSRSVTPQATFAGLLCVLYVGSLYLMVGLAKLTLPGPFWWTYLHLENAEHAMMLWHGSKLPEEMVPFQSLFLHFFANQPISYIVGFLVVAIEVLWVGTAFSRWVRWTVPPLVFGMHLMIFISTGILFLSLAVMAFALVLPYRQFPSRRNMESPAVPSPGLSKTQLAFALVFFAVFMVPYYFRPNNPFVGGWGINFTFRGVEGTHTEVYRLGYRRLDGQVVPLPFNHSGFMDYTMPSCLTYQVRDLAKLPLQQRHQNLDKLNAFLRSLRPFRSNAWLLGPLCCPPHVVAATDPLNLDTLKDQELYLLQGTVTIQGSDCKVDWSVMDTIPFPSLKSK